MKRMLRLLGMALLIVCYGLLTISAGSEFRLEAASAPVASVLPGEVPSDQRLGPLRDLNGYFPFSPSATPADWAVRASTVRRQLAVALGLWPMPEKTRLRPVIHGKIDQGDYTVEKVYFESLPGLYVTGNLYRPKDRAGRRAAVLTPHGHWKNGRFFTLSPQDLAKEIASGAEKFENGGRSVLQSRCVQMARMGCVVFHYDMLGYADNQQISEEVAHRFAKQRPEMGGKDEWGFFSAPAEARLQSIMGLQMWNSIRALDFLEGLPDVDSARIGVTGASGGGTQTFLLCALDDRPAVSFPAVMVSTAMQGGCTCENACFLRVDTGNVEIAALFAPKPLGMTAANDWTKEMQSKGFPELQRHFTILGAPDNVALTAFPQFGHNYNYPSRAAMYDWMNRHLKLRCESIEERDYPFLTGDGLSVWDNKHPRPSGGPEFERKLLQQLAQRDEKLLVSHQKSVSAFRRVYGGAWDVMLGRRLENVGSLTSSHEREIDRGGYLERVLLIRNAARSEAIPALVLQPKQWNGNALIWADLAGKRGLYEQREGGLAPRPGVRRLLENGVMVIGADLLYQGEFLGGDRPPAHNRRVDNPREAAAYTYGYNYPLFAQRVHDLLTVIQFAKRNMAGVKRVHLAGLNGAGHWAAAARAQAGDALESTALDTAGFRFENLTDIYDVDFLPGSVKYGDLPALLALGAPGKLWLAGEKEMPALVKRMHKLAGAKRGPVLADAPITDPEIQAVDWLVESLGVEELRS